ncbi:hypothetical protein KKB69_02180 [Patescibacteria group bacterium]|nr:hypothetical protein [Patescibacteria group bacterium]
MKTCEYTEAKKELPNLEKALREFDRHSPAYKKTFQKFIELLIAVKGHAWCMDEKAERKKMAGLLGDSLKKLGQPIPK